MKITFEHEKQGIIAEFSDEVVTALQSIAIRNGITPELAIAQCVVNEKLLEDQVDSGGQLLVQRGNKIHRLQFA